jgi:hypothetical protein
MLVCSNQLRPQHRVHFVLMASELSVRDGIASGAYALRVELVSIENVSLLPPPVLRILTRSVERIVLQYHDARHLSEAA